MEIEAKIKQLGERNSALSQEVVQLRAELTRHEADARSRGQSAETSDRSAALRQQVQLLARQAAAAEGESQRLREDLTKSRSEAERRTAEITKRCEELQTRVACLQHAPDGTTAARARELERRAQIEELSRAQRILTKGFEALGKHFDRLNQSRSFHFIVHTLGRLGLVSRTPRRCLESINDQFAAIRKSIRQTEANVPAPTIKPVHPSTARSSKQDTVVKQPAIELGSSNDAAKNKIEETARFRVFSSARNCVSLPPPMPEGHDSSICLIVLHRGGEDHLRRLFTSFLQVNTLSNVEFAVVLHGCSDGSREIIRAFQNRVNIKITEHEKNYSFAYSNNRAAQQTSADYLVFLNNDIVLHSDVVPELLRLLGDSRNGIVGARLLFPPDHPKYPDGLQHGGVKFRPDSANFFHRPWNVGVHIGNFDTPAVTEKFPAVTAALAACRRKDFLKVGGLCEDYFYGYEDVDLCLKFRRILGLRSVSANHVSSIHNESATGNMDSPEATLSRRANNITQLIRRHGWYLRRQWGVDKMAGNLFFSDTPLNVAFAEAGGWPGSAADSLLMPSEFGEICANEFGWNIHYLAGPEGWYNLKDVDVVVVTSDRYELSRVRNASPDLVKVAAFQSWSLQQWMFRADLHEYDVVLCSTPEAARRLRETRRKPAFVLPAGKEKSVHRQQARTFKAILLNRARSAYRIAIKIGRERCESDRDAGEHNFARSLRSCFIEQGYVCRVDFPGEWERAESFGDDVVIVLRGAERYHPKPGQVNLLWKTGAAEAVPDDEYQQFDHIFVGSQADAEKLDARLHVPITVLPLNDTAQCAQSIVKCLRQLDLFKRSARSLKPAAMPSNSS